MTGIDYGISTINLTNYESLKKTLDDLYNKIKAGKREDGIDNFETYYEKLFPTTLAGGTTYTNKLTCSTIGNTTMSNKTISLKNLLHNTLYPDFKQTIRASASPYNKISNASLGTLTKDHLCFIKLKSDQSDIEPDEHTITNILYSKYAIEIFIRIIKALIHCSFNFEKELYLFSSNTTIFIVDRKLKESDDDNTPNGIFISNKGVGAADDPPIGIYLYIGDLNTMFKSDDIDMWEKDKTYDVGVDASIKDTYIASNKFIFKANNKLYYTAGGKFYFGYLNYINNIGGNASKDEQTASPIEKILNNHQGTMTNVTLSNVKILSGSISRATLSNIRLLKNTVVKLKTEPVVGVTSSSPYTYKITGMVAAHLESGFILKENSTIENKMDALTFTNTSTFTTTESSYSGKTVIKGNNTTITPSNTVTISNDSTINSAINLFQCTLNDSEIITTTEISEATLHGYALQSDLNINTTAPLRSVTAIVVPDQNTITSATNVSIKSRFDKVLYTTASLTSYYDQNIYYIYNFLKMILNIKNDSFLTTLQYLEVNLLCFKSLLLASLRAANIFYNNRYKLSAVAISYENNFLDNISTAAGDANCAKLALKDFIKNGNTAIFATTCSSTAKLPENTTVSGKQYKYILYNKSNGSESHDNDTNFKLYDKYIYDELKKIINNDISSSASNVGIKSYQLSNAFKVKSPFKISTATNNANDDFTGTLQSSADTNEYNKIVNLFSDNKKNEFNKNYRIKIDGTSFKVTKFTTVNNNKRVEIELEASADIPEDLKNILNKGNDFITNTRVYVVKITTKDIDKEYNNIVSKTDNVEQNINMYKTKIKNNTTLYELHKSRNNLLYNQVLSYLIIVAVLISILVIINVANVEKPLIKSITLGCLVVIIILFMSYYIMNTLYIEEGFTAGSSGTTGYELCPDNKCEKTGATPATANRKLENDTDLQEDKRNFVKNFLTTNANDIILMITLKTPSIVNDSLKGNNEKLVTISKNIYNEKLYLNDVLYSKKSDSEMNVDVLKYENKNYDVYIICILYLALIMVGSYTINIYTDNKYMDLLILIMVILFVCLFTYFVLYTNRIVRTVSTNYYWGNQYENEYI